MWPALAAGGESPRTELVHNIFGANPGAIRVGSWKLVVGDPDLHRSYNGYNGWNNSQPVPASPCTAKPCLFNLAVDRQERHNLADTEPTMLAKLVARYSELRASEVSLEDSGKLHARLPAWRGTGRKEGGSGPALDASWCFGTWPLRGCDAVVSPQPWCASGSDCRGRALPHPFSPWLSRSLPCLSAPACPRLCDACACVRASWHPAGLCEAGAGPRTLGGAPTATTAVDGCTFNLQRTGVWNPWM